MTNRLTRVKVCGLTRPEDAAVAERLGAAFIGVILASGPRLLTPERARQVLGSPRRTLQRVAVFGEQSTDEIIALAETLALDVLQLHGDPTTKQVRLLRDATGRAVWPVLRVEGTTLPDEAIDLARAAGVLVLDAKVMGQLGGTGVSLDWGGLSTAVQTVRRAVPGVEIVLAGGLRAENVQRAMMLLEPDVVDVSSGVESAPGVKDPRAVEQFVSAVTAAKGKNA